jgi:hypothetical protein
MICHSFRRAEIFSASAEDVIHGGHCGRQGERKPVIVFSRYVPRCRIQFQEELDGVALNTCQKGADGTDGSLELEALRPKREAGLGF